MPETNKPVPETGVNSNGSETISNLAHRHLADENHVTTDEEIRNATIEEAEPVQVDEENLYEVDHTTLVPAIPNEPSIEEDDQKDEKRSLPNPYDVLG
ncbi:hypothetical protein EXU57_09430 [Segetibacter sp. 3557_3]|uniref:hypothetical protein n=1 Tax=Segetibacter sp. 3557_3 TaxID=2547429 RepID=UPI0010591A2D|nr:hypothetical protein [Segetibacter sp. 3557_3]TDH27012.1 hypothetical protein EXU57_09430 [Segetibacter sp. 3557_3]